MGAVDWVIAVRHGDRNEELRYSIRSIMANVRGIRRIVLIGYRPEWLVDIAHVSVPQDSGEKYGNAVRLWRVAAAWPTLARQIIVAHDDMFVMRPVEASTLLPAHCGPISEHIKRLARDQVARSWRNNMARTQDWLRARGRLNPRSFALHYPMLVDREAFARTYATLGEDAIKRQVMSIHCALESPDVREIEHDCKITGRSNERANWREWPILSTSDASFSNHPIGDFIRKAFPVPSVWESDDPEYVKPVDIEEVKFRIMAGYRYRNINTSDEVEYPKRNQRLEGLDNWTLVGAPKRPKGQPATEPTPLRWLDYRGRVFTRPAGSSLTMYDQAHTHIVVPPGDAYAPIGVVQAMTLCGKRACPTKTREIPAPVEYEKITCPACLAARVEISDAAQDNDWEPVTGERNATEPETFD